MKPMLAAATKGSNVSYPVLASAKLDGVRALIIDGVAMSRSLKPIPNKHVQKLFGRHELNGLDGELIIGSPTDPDVYRNTTSGVMSIEGTPQVFYHVFDDFTETGGFQRRLHTAKRRCHKFRHGPIEFVNHHILEDEMMLQMIEEDFLAAGYEGVMIRSLDGPYKQGRSTEKEGWLLKLKRFADSEAKIAGFQELMHNANEAKTNELGQKERSSKKAGMVGKGCLGAITVQDLKTGVEFDIGTGFTQADREKLWATRKDLIGAVVKYKYFPSGSKERPRFPVFLGFRNPIDM
jgi:DNA ligase 1